MQTEAPPRRAFAVLGLALAAALLGGACNRAPPAGTRVSGKTVFAGMGVEDVRVVAVPEAGPAAEPAATTRSGYHGSFSLRLAQGRYRLSARGTLPGPAGGERTLQGQRPLDVPTGVPRVDRVVVELREP